MHVPPEGEPNPFSKEAQAKRRAEFDPERRTKDLFAVLSAILFVVAGVWMLTITAETSSIFSEFMHAVGVFSIAMAAIPLLLRKR